MGKRNPVSLPFRQLDLRDWLVWVDAVHELEIAAGREHCQHQRHYLRIELNAQYIQQAVARIAGVKQPVLWSATA